MKQYCRYCANAHDYDGEATDFLCDADAPCGANSAGQFYYARKAKRPNKCKHFVFNENDIFRYNPNGSFCTYKPREERAKTQDEPQGEQLTIGGVTAGKD